MKQHAFSEPENTPRRTKSSGPAGALAFQAQTSSGPCTRGALAFQAQTNSGPCAKRYEPARPFAVFCGLLLLLTLLTGCTGKEQRTAPTEEPAAVSLEIWSFFDYNTPGNHYLNLWDELAEEYGYELNVKVFKTEELKDKLRISLLCGELPDVFEVWGGSFPEFLIDAGACIPVDDYLQDSGIPYKEEYISPYKDGRRYIIPCLVDAYAVNYYNKTLLEQMQLTIPETWEQLVALVDAVHAYNKAHGTSIVPIGFGNKDSWLGELMYTMIVNRENPYALDQLSAGEIDFEDEIFRDAAEKIRLLDEHHAFAEDFLQTGEVESVENFVEGQVLLLPHQSTILYYLMEHMGDDGFTMAQFPDCSGGRFADYPTYLMNANPHMTPGLCLNRDTEHADEAAMVCLEFSKRVNEINYTQYGYYNYTLDPSLEPPRQLPAPVQQFRDMLDSQQKLTGFWYYELSKESADTWSNLTKQLYAGVISVDEFIARGKELINPEHMVYRKAPAP